jgi:lipid-A-disaccharide synthase
MKLAIVAGEASGDLHASEVVRELKKLDPSLQTFGIGGDFLQRQGTKILYHARDMGIVGLFNVLRNFGMFRRVFRDFMEMVALERPDGVLLVDYPGFNLRVARRTKELGIPVLYYISPQVWAWRRGRVKLIERFVDRMIVVFPFEEEFYREHRVPVTYVGHPLVEQLAMMRRAAKKPDRIRVALLPGSRGDEVKGLLPPMLDAVGILRRERTTEAFIVQAPTIDHSQLQSIVKRKGIDVPILPHDRGEAVAAADVALSSSGTATLEAAILGTPVVVMYKLSTPTYYLARWLVKVPYFSLVNIVAGKEVVPELIQREVSGGRIAAEVRRLLANEEDVRRELAAVKARLGEAGAARRAAEAIMSTLKP